MEEPFADTATMTPQPRRREIAAILARGVLRLRQVSQSPPNATRTRRTSPDHTPNRVWAKRARPQHAKQIARFHRGLAMPPRMPPPGA
jgi:hypothetical protein